MARVLPAELPRYELDIAGYFSIFFVFAIHQITQILLRFGPDGSGRCYKIKVSLLIQALSWPGAPNRPSA